MAFILASASARRLDLLAQIGVVPDGVCPADIDETPHSAELPSVYAKRISVGKAEKIASEKPDDHILAADTVVCCGRRILPKAEDVETAQDCLTLLSGRRHRVITGIALKSPGKKIKSRLVKSTVTFKRLSDSEIKQYLESGEWHGKAGGYAIQGEGARYIRALSGSYSGVVGLPLFEVSGWLSQIGILPK